MNNKALLIIIGVLLVSNLALLAKYMVGGKEQKTTRKTERSATDYMVRELQLNESQAEQFKTLWETVKEKNRPYFDSLRTTRENLYRHLKNEPQPEETIRSIADTIARYEAQLTLNNYRHFRKVRAICDSTQQIKLDTLIQRMGKRAGRRK